MDSDDLTILWPGVETREREREEEKGGRHRPLKWSLDTPAHIIYLISTALQAGVSDFIPT